MKKFLSGIILISVLLASCKKDAVINHNGGSNTQDTAKRKVTFVIGFSQQAAGFKSNGTQKVVNGLTTNAADASFDSNPQITTLLYTVYDAGGNEIHQIKQVKGVDADFGSYTDNLNPGTYTVAVAAGKTGIFVNSGSQPQKLSTDVLRSPGDIGDLLFKKITLMVTNNNSTQDVALDRISGGLQIVIKDALPANAGSLTLDYISGYKVFNVGSETKTSIQPTLQAGVNIPVSARGSTNYTFITYFMPISQSFNVVLSCNTGSSTSRGTVIATKTIPVTVETNRMTILSGNLFGGGGGGGITTSINTSWTTSTMSF